MIDVRPDRMGVQIRIRKRAALAAVALAALSGCTVGPNYKRPDVPMPAGWVGPTSRPSTRPSTEPTTRPMSAEDLRDWWRQFHDARLESLIGRAIDSNYDIREATSRLVEAREARIAAASVFYPNATVDGAYARSGGFTSKTPGRNAYSLNLDAAWELDIFGGNRRTVEASDANIQAAVEDRRDVLISTIAELATDYVNLRGFQREIEIAKGNLELQRHTLALTQQKLNVGFVGSLDVANAQASVAETLSAIPQLEREERQTIYALSILLAREPGALLSELSPHAPTPQAPQSIPELMPSELLLRRPDVRRADAQLHVATANIGVATADLFPKFALNGSVGTGQAEFGDLLRIANQSWSIGPSVTYSAFDAGRIRANIEIQKAITEQQLDAYKATILTALQDVENALIAYDRELLHRRSLADAVAANQRAVDISTQLYSAGETDFLNVLSAQRSLFSSEDSLAQSDATLSNDLIGLYRAMGGGWSEDQPESAAPH